MPVDLSSIYTTLRADEGERLSPYRCTEGFLTVGVGHNLDAKPISKRASQVILEDDVADVLAELDRALPWWRGLPARRGEALVYMGFQLGVPGLVKFRKMLAALQAGDGVEAQKQALDSRWADQTPARARRIAAMLKE